MLSSNPRPPPPSPLCLALQPHHHREAAGEIRLGFQQAATSSLAAMLEHNIVTHWLVKVFSGTANSAWHGTVLVTFIFALSGSNAAAGVAEAAQNTAALAASLPLGTLADRWSAARTVCGGGAFVLVATATTSLAAVGGAAAVSESGRGRAYALLVVAMALWGVVNATIDGPAQALYASSMRRADRTRLMTRAFQLYTMAAVAGRGLSAAVFWAHGDAWSLPALRDAILVGVGCEVLAGGAQLPLPEACRMMLLAHRIRDCVM